MAQIDSIYDLSDKALGELKAWLEPWFLGRKQLAAAAVDTGVDEDTTVQTTNGTITVDPTLILDIGAGLVLTQPTTGTAHVSAAGTSTSHERVSGASGSLAAGASILTGIRNWSHVSGATLLNYTVPTIPTIVTTGMYIFQLTLGVSEAITAGRSVWVEVNWIGGGGSLYQYFPSNTLAGSFVSVTFAQYFTAGDNVRVFFANDDTISHTCAIHRGEIQRVF